MVCPTFSPPPGPLAALTTQPLWAVFMIAFTAAFVRWRPEFLGQAPPAARQQVAILHTMMFVFITLGWLLLVGVAVPWHTLIEQWYSGQIALPVGTTCPLTPLDAAHTAVSREANALMNVGAAFMFCGCLFSLLLSAMRRRARRAAVGAR